VSFGDESYFLDYLNSFSGDNILEKYKNILKAWENDVSFDLNLSLGEKSVKVQLSYIIAGIPDNFGEPIFIKNDKIEVLMDIPKKFNVVYENIPIYDIVHRIKYGVDLDLTRMTPEDRRTVIDNLPADLYNKLTEAIYSSNKIISYDNTNLADINLNFMSNDPYLFLRGLFTPYGKDYYRDIIFHLAKQIGSETLMESTMMDVEYYIDKLNESQPTETTQNLF
jgi:hypothetical protein